jgi:molecular chaperone DnaK (HSP70)
MPLKLVIKEYLRLFSDNILKYVNLKGKSYSKDDIQWIITVPAIWNDYGKQLMVECSKKAGMNDISIALEPEAASLTMFNDNIVDKYLKEKGKKFMLIDAGGYTIDITLNEIIDNHGNLKQLSPPSGGAFGSMNINKDLINLVEEMFGKEKIDYLKEYRYDLWKITLDSIEKKKKEIKNDGSDAESFKIDTRFEENVCTSIYKCEKETSYGSVKFNNNYLEVPRGVMKYIILKNVNPIINLIKDLFENFQNITIDVLILTGGFSNCKLLIDEIHKNFKNCPHKILSKPETSVMNGAVLYGIDPNKIISRKTPYTIGISTYSSNIPGTECKKKIMIDSNIYCEYFDIFKRKGDDIKNNEYIIKSYIPLLSNQTGIRFNLYYSTSANPIYIDKENAKKIAEFSLVMKETDRKLEEREATCKMVFSSSITVSAKNVLSGEEVKIIANYYNRND